MGYAVVSGHGTYDKLQRNPVPTTVHTGKFPNIYKTLLCVGDSVVIAKKGEGILRQDLKRTTEKLITCVIGAYCTIYLLCRGIFCVTGVIIDPWKRCALSGV